MHDEDVIADDGYNTENVTVKWTISTGFAAAEHRGEWVFAPGELPTDPADRARQLDECLQEEISNRIEGWYEDV